MKIKMKSQQELHNRLVLKITKQIIETPLKSGGDYADVILILESIAVGVFLVGKNMGYGEQATMDEFVSQLKERISNPKEPVSQEQKQ
jgi:hypothetical protein